MNKEIGQLGQGNTSGDLGNTKQNQITKEKKQPIKSRYWCFTYNNYELEDLGHLEQTFRANNVSYIIGLELAPSTNTRHLQGFISFPKVARPSQLKLSKKIHWEKIKGSQLQNIKYCAKSGNYRIHGLVVPKVVSTITILKQWQQNIVNLYNTPPNGRTCNWIVDEEGGKGKSALCKYLAVNLNVTIIQGGKLSDIMNIMFNLNLNELKMICIDVPRNNTNKVSYSAIECILNGQITNTKYETGIKYFDPPHVVVFSNFEPEYEKLSLDRWNVTVL